MDMLLKNHSLGEIKIILKDIQIDRNFIVKASLFGLSTLTLFYIGKIWYSYKFFKKRGFKTPEVEFFFGNVRSMFRKKNLSDQYREWTKTCGKTYGYFEGHQPVFVTSDLDIIQEILIKQSSNFAARKKMHLNPSDNNERGDLLIATNARWKRMRMVMNPTFSSAKLKELSPVLISCTDRLIDVLDKEIGNEINISEYLKRFTMDSIWNCAFGVDINIQYERENDYFKKCEELFKSFSNLNLISYLADYFHEFREIIVESLFLVSRFLSLLVDRDRLLALIWLRHKIKDLVEIRKKSADNIKRKDYIQILLEANQEFKNNKEIDKTQIKRYMTDIEVESNLVLFMLAGYETTSNTLANSSYVLATIPEQQEKLYNYLSSVFSSDSEVNSENVVELEYLDWFVKEVLRCYPIGTLVRRCTKATTVKGIDMPFDMPIAIDVLSVHYDPELWGPVDPDIFYPQRHAIKRNQMAFLAFGNGPRNCIGMKFALIELKLALTKLILNFEFLKSDKVLYDKLEFEEGIVRTAINGVTVILKKRNKNN